MVGSENKGLAIDLNKEGDLFDHAHKMGDDSIPSNHFSVGQDLNLGIVNQYGQLMGEYSRLDDELWLSETQDDEAEEGGQCHIVPFHENLVDLAQQSDYVDNSVTRGAMMSVNENSSSLKCIFKNKSQISSPISVLQTRKSYSDIRTATHPLSQHLQPIEHNSSGGFQSLGTIFSARQQSQGFESDQSEYSMGSSFLDDSEKSIPSKHPVRTRKLSDLLDLDLEPPAKQCLHCDTTETPQWRTGPMGRKTLCNACGVQYKHGRLFPDYRPLRSPTFDPSLHSNLPKKAQEMKMGKTSERFPTPSPKPKKFKESTPAINPSLCSDLGKNVQEVRLWYTSERHPNLTPKPKKIGERSPASDPSVRSILDKKVQEMIMRDTSARDPNLTPKPRRVEEMRLGSTNEYQSRADRAKKFQDMRDKTSDIRLTDSRERNQNSEGIVTVEQKKPLKVAKKCLHCESTKTPQWREGPMGRNTLCNACGVQYRHGRLFPEYCPLKSPKYDPSLHSYLPKKVLEMRMRYSEKCASSANCEEPA